MLQQSLVVLQQLLGVVEVLIAQVENLEDLEVVMEEGVMEQVVELLDKEIMVELEMVNLLVVVVEQVL
tara:strand:- start:264 stop:467 length:204 start_codon:yes stop_codon:yes gene_type:complete